MFITHATTSNQRIYKTELGHIKQTIKEHDIEPPTIVVVGKVVSLSDKLAPNIVTDELDNRSL